MSIRTIMAAVSGGSATGGAIELSCQLARRFEAHLEGFHVQTDAKAIFAAAESFGAPSTTLVDSVKEEAVTKAERTRALFWEIVEQHGIPHNARPQLMPSWPSASWREESGNAPALVARRGRFFDLLVLGRSDRVVREPFTDTIEDTLLRSGRPVLLAPADPPSGVGHVVAVAWNGSPQAARALTLALPFIQKASNVFLLTAGDGQMEGTPEALDYLAWHQVNAKARNIPVSSSYRLGRVLIESAQEAGADLLVMGGYGQTPWREALFGGVTREAIGTMTIPLFLAH